MSVRIRLSRLGRKKSPIYRIVVADSRCPRDGRFLDIVGAYSPRDNDQVTFKTEKLESWLEKGAMPTDTVARLIRKAKA